MTNSLERLYNRLRWRYARWRGEQPTCAKCSHSANWIIQPEDEPRCVMHDPDGPFGMIREVEPDDYLTDWGETDD